MTCTELYSNYANVLNNVCYWKYIYINALFVLYEFTQLFQYVWFPPRATHIKTLVPIILSLSSLKQRLEIDPLFPLETVSKYQYSISSLKSSELYYWQSYGKIIHNYVFLLSYRQYIKHCIQWIKRIFLAILFTKKPYCRLNVVCQPARWEKHDIVCLWTNN